MFKFLFLVLILNFSSINATKLNYRDEFQFVTHWYNSTNCSSYSIKNMTIHSRCYDNQIINGYPKCCYDFLNNINVFKTHNFKNCIDTNYNSIHPISISYSCDIESKHKMTFTEVVTIIGLIGILLISSCSIGMCVLLLCKCCNKEREGYNQF